MRIATTVAGVRCGRCPRYKKLQTLLQTLAPSLAVAEPWMEAAGSESLKMFARAEYLRDQLQEDLKVPFETPRREG